MQRCRHAGIETKHPHRTRLVPARARDRRTHVQRVQPGKFLDIALHEISQLQQDSLPLCRLKFTPWTIKSLARRCNRAVYVLCIAFGDMGKNFAGRWIAGLKRFAGSGFQPLAADQHAFGLAIQERMDLCHNIH